jgi:Na+/melibiose symporter-like transporter
VYRDSLWWNIGFSSYWFATSYKWFILLFIAIPDHVARIAGPDQKNAAWGGIYALGAAWAVFGPTVFGAWSDRASSPWGHRQPFIAAGAGLTVVGLFAVFHAPSLPLLAAAYLLLQVADDVGTGPYGGMVPEIVPEAKRGRASAVLTLVQRIGELVSAGAGILLQRTDLIFIGVGAVNVLCAAWTIWTVRGVRPLPEASREVKSPFWSVWVAPWKSPDFRTLWISRFLTMAAAYLVTNYILYYLQDMFPEYWLGPWNLHNANTSVMALALTVSVAGSLGAAFAVKVADSWGRKRLVYLSTAMIVTVLVPFALTRDYTVLWLLAWPFGVGQGIRGSVDWAMAADVLPQKEESGGQMGLWSSSQTAVQILVGGSGAMIQHLNGHAMGLGYMAAIFTAGGLFLTGSLLVQRIRGSR